MQSGELSQHLVRIETAQQEDMPSPAALAHRRLRRWLIGLIFVLPVTLALIYNLIVATPRYASAMSFVVRTTNASRDRFSFLNMSKANGEDDSEAILAYIRSREALAVMNHDGLIAKVFSDPRADMFSRFPTWVTGYTRDDFYKHFQHYVSAKFDRATNITTVEVQAFSAKDAQQIGWRMATASEAMINRLNDRARRGIVASAERDEDQASENLAAVLRRMGAARNAQHVLEPKLEATAAIKLSSTTASELASINVQLAQAMTAAPNNPQVGMLRARRVAIEKELARQGWAQTGSPSGLADRMGALEGIDAEREIAEKRLLAASLVLVSARSSADRQQLYVERISDPSQPDETRYPRAILNIGLTLLVCASLLWIALSLSELIAEND